MKSCWLLPLVLLLSSCAAYATPQAVPPPAPTPAPAALLDNPIPVFAYYYIWFDEGMWDRAKTDYPLLGRYSSDDIDVMRAHVFWAKSAGIKGFIVSWKNTPKLTERLSSLIQVAQAEDFELAVIYQGLDFGRKPLPASVIEADLDLFISRFAGSKVFRQFEKPIVILSGTWEFSTEEVAAITAGRRDELLILASEKNTAGYDRLADLVDGNAYYWSSVDPWSTPGYIDKLQALSEAVHAKGGIWIAPAASGFDARLVGGTRIINRRDGETLRAEMNAALQSSPDLVGLISWNEFSENSHIEPSEEYGERYLEVMAEIQGALPPVSQSADSSEPGETSTALTFSQIAAIGGLVFLFVVAFSLVVWRSRH